MSNRDVREAFPLMGYYVLGRRRSGGGAWLVRSIDDGSEWEGRVLQASATAATACTPPDPAAEAFLQRRHRHVERVVARRSDAPVPPSAGGGSPPRAYTVSEVLSPICADARFSRPVSDDAFWAAASELLQGLCSFHSNGFRHGDVCLGNVRVATSAAAASAAAVKLANACVDGRSGGGCGAEDVRGLALALWELCTGESLSEILQADGAEVRRRVDERVTACLGELCRYCPQLGAEACALPGQLYGCGHGAEECLLWSPVASRVLCAWYAPFVCRTLQALGRARAEGGNADEAGCGCGLPRPLCVCAAAAAAAAEEGCEATLLFSLSGHKVLAAGGPAEGHASAVAAALRWKADVAAWRSEVVGWRRRQQRRRQRRRRRLLQGGDSVDGGSGGSEGAPPIPELPFVIRSLGHSSASDGGCGASGGGSRAECAGDGSGGGFSVSAVVAGGEKGGLQASAGTTQTAFTIPHAGSIAGISFAGAATGKTVGTFETMTQAPRGGGGEDDSTISCSSLFSLMYGSDDSTAAVCVETLLSHWSDDSASSALSTHTHNTY